MQPITPTFVRFPKIGQFRDAIKHVTAAARWGGYDENNQPIFLRTARAPVLDFTGTVKLHGTNAAVVMTRSGDDEVIHFQSREQIITPVNDNAGFAVWAGGIDWSPIFDKFIGDNIIVYGEWCGGNIQQGTIALTKLPKMFVIFKVMVDGEWYQDLTHFPLPLGNVHRITDFPRYHVTIDFENPAAQQNLLGELTLSVEQQCPVGFAFGVSGTGEGIVWTCNTDPSIMFKVKGEKHAGKSKVKTLPAVDPLQLASIKEFADEFLTERRMEQGIEFLVASGIEVSVQNTGVFIRWVYNDITTEEQDSITLFLQETGLAVDAIGKVVSAHAKRWFFDKLEQLDKI